MQTFLPHPEFDRSAASLDDRRLGKQRVETLQILRALHVEDYGWGQHPAVTMWRGHTAALVSYGAAVVSEWLARGYADTTYGNIAEFVHPDRPRVQPRLAAAGELPAWLGWERLHASHRAALVRKDPVRYGPLFPDVSPHQEYVWPDPPAPPAPRGRRDAWVVRGRRDGAGVRLDALADEQPWIPLGERGGRRTKRERQIERFVLEVDVGDPLVVPTGDALHVGRVTGAYRHERGCHTRKVAWHGVVARRDLRFPAALQDPQAVFALYDEPLLAAAPRRAAGRR